MIKLLIIADDFTGALDTGVQFAADGAATYVMVNSEIDYTKIASNVEVLVIDTETRHLDKIAAYQKIFSIVHDASKIGIPYIYKKTDSALRGNIGAELAAALKASGERHIHFVPAFPKMGRTTVKGIHYVNEIPVSESAFGRDPFEPVRYSEIKKIIASQSEVKTHVVGNNVPQSCDLIDGVLIYDSNCNKDIENITSELIKKSEMHLIAGCAGFAYAISRMLKFEGEKPEMPKIKANILVACGSVNPVSVAQCDDAEKRGAPRFRLTPKQKMNPNWVRSSAADVFIDGLYDSCKKNHIVILDTNDKANDESTITYAEKKGISLGEMRTNIMSAMGYVLERLIDKGFNSTILIMGGDSLVGFAQQAGIKAISPICEMDCGVVLSKLKYNEKTLNVISKSGGFGKETLFNDLSKTLLKLNEGKDI